MKIGELPPVHGDEVELRALLQNLVANAFKYASNAETRVRVAGERRGERVRITVSDNDPGVPWAARCR